MVSYDETALNRDDIIQSVEKAGYGASVKEETQKSQVSSNTGAEKKDAAKEQYKLMKSVCSGQQYLPFRCSIFPWGICLDGRCRRDFWEWKMQ